MPTAVDWGVDNSSHIFMPVSWTWGDMLLDAVTC